jgi:hypothetical protein
MPAQIVYISGSGRSGSTLLERIFHSAPGVAAVGEFHCLWRMAADEIACACGKPFHDDAFWAAVRERAGFDTAMAAELRELESRVCRTAYIARHGFSLARLGSDPGVMRFLELQDRLFGAIADESGAHTVVDSSKAGPRAWLLACLANARLIHLYRDPEDVIASWRSRKFDPGLGTPMARPSISSAAVDWLKAELLARRLETRRPIVRMDYADLCRAPRDEFGRVSAKLDLPEGPAPQWTGPDSFLQGDCYHSLNGNPDRFERGPVKISFRRPARDAAPRRERLAINAAARLLKQLAPPRSRI